jgi:hypothetical protein
MNIVHLFVDLSLTASLDFSSLEKEMEEIVSKGGRIFWEINFDFDLVGGLFTHPLRFSTYQMSLKEFSSQILEKNPESAVGLSLYRGESSISSILERHQELMQMYQELLENKTDTPFDRELFSLTIFVEFLHRLGSIIPETIPLHCFFHLSHEYTLAQLATLFSKERFLHLKFHIEGSLLPFEEKEEPTWGIVLPQEQRIDYELLDEMLTQLLKKTAHFRILPEGLISELWHGLDNILFASKSLTKDGKRMLQGFNAAGGRAVYFDQSVGLVHEESFNI